MDITTKNFPELLPAVKEAIAECTFLAIDTELTGLSTQVTEHAFDTMPERYSKLRENCSKFLIIQFGLSTFKYHPAQKKYTHRDFNFYIFPRPHIRQAPDPKFMCQASSLHFLASHGFDFNKVICEGISYLTPLQEEKIRGYLTNRHKIEKEAIVSFEQKAKTNGQKEVDVPEEHKQFIAEIHEKVDSFISNDSEMVIQLEPCSSYRRKLIYETVQMKHQTGIEMSSSMNADNKRVITIVKTTSEEKLDKLHLKQINDMGDLDVAIGFRKVLDCISESKKLVVGHNMLLDIMHVMDQFFHPLPEDLKEFKQMLRLTFPHILDTKHMASSEKFRSLFETTHLFELFKQLQGKAFDMPKVEAEDGFKGYNIDSKKLHEAGFDAFITGLCYIGLSTKLGMMQNPNVNYIDTSSKLLSPYCNRIFIMRHYDIMSINLSGPDPEPNRDNVFYVSFPEEWKTVDLVELFLPYGNIYVNWLDDVSALVALRSEEHTISAKSALLNRSSRVYRVRTFSDYQAMVKKYDDPKSEAKKSQKLFSNESSGKKRRASGSSECAVSMDLIPEGDENEAEKIDDSVSTSHENNSTSEKTRTRDSGLPSPKRQ
ncbi:Poly(A)-specific ribonuclease PARN, partial [Stegodyphus mimosarum]